LDEKAKAGAGPVRGTRKGDAMPENEEEIRTKLRDFEESRENWAEVQLMGHITILGRLIKPCEDTGGLWKVETPKKEGGFSVRMFGNQAVYLITQSTAQEIREALFPSQNEIPF
jgi:hypothetical protein